MDLLLNDTKTGKCRTGVKGRPQSGAPTVVLSHPRFAIRVETKIKRSRERARRWVLRELDCLLQQRGPAAIKGKTDWWREVE
ncbi:hypothetical protein FG93_00152 [Bosea sp. LC85]|uniref:hypothetical protein n=1 Tax=Bosea sp. LC85 TaxID=1502851 RepID=UPI0004E387EB|nr:hypothetical protein [Bosea sp. LC85]KFC76012.1 hypothetical protein FG93_00152 [Bosea sp. LC85]